MCASLCANERMKRIEYTAGAIRVAGILLAVMLAEQSVDISASLPTGVYSASIQPTFHVLGIPIMTAQAGLLLTALIKAAAAAAMIFYAQRLAKLFWMGILPEVPEDLRRVLARKKAGPNEADSDPWSDSV